jgi:hypothetical protein
MKPPPPAAYGADGCVCIYLEIRPSPDRSPPGPSVEKHSGQGTFSEQPDTVVPPTEADQPHDNCGLSTGAPADLRRI